jgi:Ca2+-binding EF-hand superfamily protein
MLGVIGNFAMSTRIFRAIDRKGKGKIYLEDYLIYNAIVSYGTQTEKNKFTFGTIDVAKRGRVNF